MEKSTSTATQIYEPPPPSAASSVPAQDLPPPATSDQRSSPAMVAAESPSVAMDLDSSPAFTPAAAAPAQVPAPTDPSSRGRKRALEGNLKMENSNYYKMRHLLKDLRPHVLEVLQTPDFRNSKAAIEIQEKMKLMLQLYREMIGETPKNKKTTKSESSLSNGKAINTDTEKLNSNGNGDSVVGGSAFGWNFVTNGGTQAVYCGMPKEEYRSSHPIPQMEAEVELPNTVQGVYEA